MKRATRCCFLLMLLGAAWAASAATVLMHDGFSAYRKGSDADPMWVAESGDWRVTAEGYEGAGCEGHYTAVGTRSGRKEWTDYALSLELKVASRGTDWRDGAWIGIRHQDVRNVYTIGFYSRLTAIHKASKGAGTTDENPLAQTPATIGDDRWHAVRVAAQGATITVSLDGKVILEATDKGWNNSPPVAAGGIVLMARKHSDGEGVTRVVFRNVRVEALGKTPATLAYTLADARKLEGARRRQVSLLGFLQAQRTRRYERVPRKVLAFYYTWYGRPERHGAWVHWADVKPEEHDIATSTHYPAKGAYDSHDPAIIDHHIDLAKSHGVDAFIATWWSPKDFHDRAFPLLLERARAKGFEASVYWETVPGKGRGKIDRAVNDLAYVLKTYGAHPAFLKVEGKPVVFVYGRVMNQVATGEWPEIITRARERYGKDFLLIADGYREDFARLFDGLHVYNICGWVRGKKPAELAELSGRSFADAVALQKSRARVTCLTIIPGYDDTKIRTPGINAERQDGETYRVLWEQAIKADPDWVVITSWNEWHEGSEIEPSWEDGDKYLKMTAKHAAQFKRTPHSRVAVPKAPPGPRPEAARAMRELFKGATIGILPGFGGKAVSWLAETGVSVAELTWDDVIAPRRLDPKNYPVLVYAGFEEYVQTVKEQGDVDRAIQRYLRGRGCLVVLPTGPFPFYYNERREAVVSPGRFGLPICGSGAHGRHDVPANARLRGWEKPPAGAKVRFTVDTTHLPGLPKTVPFPASGDVRWRPCTLAGLAPEDVYVRLVRLSDGQGVDYGDGIAYIEHVRTEPRGGRLLYAWMRMADVVDADDLFLGLFRLAARGAQTGEKR